MDQETEALVKVRLAALSTMSQAEFERHRRAAIMGGIYKRDELVCTLGPDGVERKGSAYAEFFED